MNGRPDWSFGTVLVRRHETVLFVSWDDERTRMMTSEWFMGIRLSKGLTSSHKVGALGNYKAAGFRMSSEGVAR